jgi:O-antigen/teichoic acid export membrane protein
VGAFSRANSITIRLSDVTYRLAAVIYPSLVREREHGSDATFAATVVRTFRTTFAPCLLAAAAAAGASHTILLLFGPGFVAAQGALAFLLLAAAIALGDMILAEALTAKDRPHLSSLGGVAGMVAVVATVVPLTKAFGATGAAAAIFLGSFVAFVVHARSLGRLMPGVWAQHHLVRGLVLLVGASASAFAFVFAVQELLGSRAVFGLGALMSAALGVGLVLRRRRSVPTSAEPAAEATGVGDRHPEPAT